MTTMTGKPAKSATVKTCYNTTPEAKSASGERRNP